MTAPDMRTSRDELDNIDDALVEAILNASERELRDDVAEAGGNPDNIVAEVSSLIARAQMEYAKKRLESAKHEVASFKSQARRISDAQRQAARARLERLRSQSKSGMLLAARKGGGESQGDLDSLIEDIADLESLEGDAEEE